MDKGSSEPVRASSAGEDSNAYLTAPQVADLLQVDSKTVYRWASKDPSLPVLKISGVVRFPRERLLRWLREREQGTPRMIKQVRSLAKPAPLQGAV